MPIKELVRIKQTADLERTMSLALAMNCAPLLKGSKAANVMTVTLQEFNMIKYIMRGIDISYYLLKTRGDKFIIYMYRKDALMKYLSRPEVREFLEEYGYDTDSFSMMLVRLSVRSKEFCNGNEFPHEIGAFLEYPIEDIRGYLANNGEKFLYTGYWRVYHNVEHTKKLFRQFDEERESSVREVLQGKTIREICCLKN